MKRAAPEHALQVQVKRYLSYGLPTSIDWTASAAGVPVTMNVAVKMKAAGVRRGWPDLAFLFPDGVTRYIELKAGASLSPEQRAFRDRCQPHNIFAVCRSVEDVRNTLESWGVRMPALLRPGIASASAGPPQGP